MPACFIIMLSLPLIVAAGATVYLLVNWTFDPRDTDF